jgi:hypothetical protein
MAATPPPIGQPPSGAPAPGLAPPPSPPAGQPSGPPPGGQSSTLRRRRDELAEQVAEAQWDLGGLAYEMAVRDHFRLDVLVRRAAQMQERDAELAEVERLLHQEEHATIGACSICAAPHSRGALYCWQCGTTLMARAPSGAGTVTANPFGPAGGRGEPARSDDAGGRGEPAGRDEDGGDRAEQDTLIMGPLATAEE